MFHVKHSLFAQAETAEERIQHIFDSRTSGQLVKCRARRAKVFRHQDEITGFPDGAEGVPDLQDVGSLSPVERDRVLRWKNRAGELFRS